MSGGEDISRQTMTCCSRASRRREGRGRQKSLPPSNSCSSRLRFMAQPAMPCVKLENVAGLKRYLSPIQLLLFSVRSTIRCRPLLPLPLSTLASASGGSPVSGSEVSMRMNPSSSSPSIASCFFAGWARSSALAKSVSSRPLSVRAASGGSKVRKISCISRLSVRQNALVVTAMMVPSRTSGTRLLRTPSTKVLPNASTGTKAPMYSPPTSQGVNSIHS
mmetsp:Transcript_8441/g.35272  ORF Transcript_8441/g.35272 Transcript_8441/m.35272 type:complete len:219 (-) Transcript_8441:1273-1929(-)